MLAAHPDHLTLAKKSDELLLIDIVCDRSEWACIARACPPVAQHHQLLVYDAEQ